MSELLEAKVDSLERNRISQAGRICRLEKWVDTVSSPLRKRLWFVIQGYRFRQLGVWYKAEWNKDGWNY